MAKLQNVIAIIDDDAAVRAGLERLLGHFGYRTELYGSAEEFVHAVITTEALCLIIDIQLGDISGVELGRQLSATGFDFPIIFMTGSQDETQRRQAMDFGCVEYLNKPFHADQLILAVTKAIGHASDRKC
jgi:FixJ family two-component response regulator